MALSILDHKLLLDPVGDQAEATAPVAGVAYSLDIAWGLATSDAAAVVSTVLSCAGATIDTSYAGNYRGGHTVSVSGRTVVDMGWSPDSLSAYLRDTEYAAGLWRLTFPSAATYTVSLLGIGTFDVVVGAADPITAPTLLMILPNPMNRQPAKLHTLSFNGTYPSGGLDLNDADVGLNGIFFADILPVPPLQFAWSNDKLTVYNDAGEVSGALNFTTTGLFIGGGI